MSSQALNKRLNEVKNRIPVSVKPEEEKALKYIVGYLDTLACRKQTGDPTVQAEIEAVSAFMKSNCTI
jgi:hypothetical protein